MCEILKIAFPIAAFLATAFAGGYIAAIIQRRFKSTDIFCDLILSEIKESSVLHDNIGGEFCISDWHSPSTRRIAAYTQMVDWTKFIGGKRVLEACDEYQKKEVGIGFRREHIVASLADIYKKAKQTT